VCATPYTHKAHSPTVATHGRLHEPPHHHYEPEVVDQRGRVPGPHQVRPHLWRHCQLSATTDLAPTRLIHRSGFSVQGLAFGVQGLGFRV
jgi:hypothetical protein